MICPPDVWPELVPRRARRTCPTCNHEWIAVGQPPRWRPVRWWHRLTTPKPKETP